MYTELPCLANEFLITKKQLYDNLLGKSFLNWHKAQLCQLQKVPPRSMTSIKLFQINQELCK